MWGCAWQMSRIKTAGQRAALSRDCWLLHSNNNGQFLEGAAECHVCMCRDVKLENIFIADDGRVRLGDFGLTMSMKQELAISPVGTVEYMAPEVHPLYHSTACSCQQLQQCRQ